MVRGCPWFGLVLIVAYVLAFVLGPVDRGSTPGRALAGPPGRAGPTTGRLVGQAPGPASAGAPAVARPVAPPAQIAPFPPLPPCDAAPLLLPCVPPWRLSSPTPAAVVRGERGAGRLQRVDDRTFVLRQGVWTDTIYAAGQTTRRVVFGTDAYFALLAERPELTPYFALGDRVIVVLDGQAYEVAAD